MTDETHEVAAFGCVPAGTYAVLVSAYPTPVVGPCRVKLDTAAVESMSAAHQDRLRKGIDLPDDCPEGDNAVHQLAIAGVASLAAVFGAIGFLFA